MPQNSSYITTYISKNNFFEGVNNIPGHKMFKYGPGLNYK